MKIPNSPDFKPSCVSFLTHTHTYTHTDTHTHTHTQMKIPNSPGFEPLCVSFLVVEEQNDVTRRNVFHKLSYVCVSGGGPNWRSYYGAVIVAEEPWKQTPQSLIATRALYSSISTFMRESPQLLREVTHFKYPAEAARPFVAEFVDRHVCTKVCVYVCLYVSMHPAEAARSACQYAVDMRPYLELDRILVALRTRPHIGRTQNSSS
jgi:hypothetical protein